MTRSTKRLTDAPEPVAPEHVSATIAEIEQAAPAPAPTPQPALAIPKPIHQLVDGRGAHVWVKTGPHTVETQWSPTAKPAPSIPLPLGADLAGTCFMLARQRGLDRMVFIQFCHANTQLVRACARRYRDGLQLVEFDPLIAAFKAASA